MTATSDVAGLTAADVMTCPAVTVEPHESLLSAWELLNRGGFRHLPVVRADGLCVSLIDDRAVIVELSQMGLRTRQVDEVMPRRVHCALSETEVRDVAQIMVTEKVTAVPVIDARHRLVGIVTDYDLVALLARPAQEESSSLERDLPDDRRSRAGCRLERERPAQRRSPTGEVA